MQKHFYGKGSITITAQGPKGPKTENDRVILIRPGEKIVFYGASTVDKDATIEIQVGTNYTSVPLLVGETRQLATVEGEQTLRFVPILKGEEDMSMDGIPSPIRVVVTPR